VKNQVYLSFSEVPPKINEVNFSMRDESFINTDYKDYKDFLLEYERITFRMGK